jgi:hypothetical protein
LKTIITARKHERVRKKLDVMGYGAKCGSLSIKND